MNALPPPPPPSYHPDPLDTAFDTALLAIGIITTVLQAYVIWLVWRVSPPAMHDYRFFLLQFAVWDTIFTNLIAFGLRPVLLFPYSAALVEGPFALGGLTGAYIGLCVTMFSAVQMLAAQSAL